MITQEGWEALNHLTPGEFAIWRYRHKRKCQALRKLQRISQPHSIVYRVVKMQYYYWSDQEHKLWWVAIQRMEESDEQ